MFCHNCGISMYDGVKFCSNCGASALPSPSVKPQRIGTLNIYRSLAMSPCFLVAAICYTLSLILGIINLVVGVDELFFQYDLHTTALKDYETEKLLIILLLVIPTITISAFMIYGVWDAFASAAGSGGLRTGGLTCILVCLYIQWVVSGISYVLVTAITGSMVATINAYSDLQALRLSSVVLFILTVGIFLFTLYYFAIVTRTVRTVRKAFKEQTACEKLPVSAAVFGFIISAVVFVLTVVICVKEMDGLVLVTSLLSIAAIMSFSIFILKFNSVMEEARKVKTQRTPKMIYI